MSRQEKIINELGFKDINDYRYDQNYNTQIKPVTVAPKTPKVPQGRDTFQTPNYAIDLLLPFIPKHRVHTVWEPACGDGKIVKRILEKTDLDVYASDIRQSETFKHDIHNFITEELPFEVVFEKNWNGIAIITNPPFSIKEKFIEEAFKYKKVFAFLINADYHGQHIDWIRRGCEKIIPDRRIDFITPTGRNGKTSSSQFHSMWLTWGFELGRTETFVELSLKEKKENI